MLSQYYFIQKPPRGIWEVWWLSCIRQHRRIDIQALLKWILLGSSTLIFLYLTGLVFHRLWTVLWREPLLGFMIASTLWSGFLSFVFVFLIYSNLLTTLTTFYGAEDLPLLLSTPLPYWKLNVQRTLETIVRSSAMMLFILIPALFTQWQVTRADAEIILQGVAALFVFVLEAGLFGVWLGQIVASHLPARRVSQVLVLLGLTLTGGLVVALRAAHLELLWSEQADINQLMEILQRAAGPLSQLRLSQEMAGLILGSFPVGDRRPYPIAISATLIFSIMLIGFRAEYRFWAGWQKAGVGSVSSAPWPRRIHWLRRLGVVPGALIGKDLLTELRTGRRWSQLMMMVPLGAVYVINLRSIPGDTDQLAPLFGWLNFIFAAFIVIAISTRFLVPAASMEGRAAWVWRKGPVSSTRWFMIKLIGYLPIALCSGLGFFMLGQWGVGISIDSDFHLAFYVLLSSLSIGTAALALGAAFPVADVRHELQASLGTGGLLFMVMALGYLFLMGYVLVWPSIQSLDIAQYMDWSIEGLPGPPWIWILGASFFMMAPTVWMAVWRWEKIWE